MNKIRETSEVSMVKVHQAQKDFFASYKTRDISFRIEQLKKLKRLIKQNENKIQEALWLDLHKSPEEAYLTEISIVKTESQWMGAV